MSTLQGSAAEDKACTWVRHQGSRLDMPRTVVSREAMAEPWH